MRAQRFRVRSCGVRTSCIGTTGGDEEVCEQNDRVRAERPWMSWASWGAACGPPPAGATSSMRTPPRLRTQWRRRRTVVVGLSVPALASARGERLGHGDRAARRRGQRRPLVRIEALVVAHHSRNPLGGVPIPALDQRAGGGPSGEGALSRREDRAALRQDEAVRGGGAG